MNIFKPVLYVNNSQFELENQSALRINNELVYVPTAIAIGILGIPKRETIYNYELQELIFIKNKKTVIISKNHITIDGEVLYEKGFIEYYGSKYVPLKIITEAFNGTYLETQNSLEIQISQ